MNIGKNIGMRDTGTLALLREVRGILGIKVRPGTEQQLIQELRRAKEVSAIYISLDEYDIIAFLNVNGSQNLRRFVNETVDSMESIVTTHITLVK